MFFAPDFFGDPDNYIPANPLVTPAHIVPEWYYLPFYAILRAVPDNFVGQWAGLGYIIINAKLAGVLPCSLLDPGVVRPALARHVEGAQRALPPDHSNGSSGSS